jgi:hypothetical protein
MGEEQVTPQRVQALAFVELSADSPPEFFVSDIPTEVDGADETATFLPGSRRYTDPTTLPTLRVCAGWPAQA